MGRAEACEPRAVAPLGTARGAGSAEPAGQRPPPACARSGGRGRGAGSGGRGRGPGGRGRGGAGSEVAYAPSEELDPEDGDVREVQLWRGITGQIFTTIRCKPSTTVLQAKEAVEALTGVPLKQQRLLSFGSRDVLTDDALVCTECISSCGGLQIMIDDPRPIAWEDSSSEEDPLSSSEDQKSDAAAEDRQGSGGPSAREAEGGPEAGAGGAGAARAARRGPAKLQHHLVLPRELQMPGFDVLRRDTGVSLRLHGPGIRGAGRHEEEPAARRIEEQETELILSLSSKAVARAEELVRGRGGLLDQLRRFCEQRRLPAPGDLELWSLPGYRPGAAAEKPKEPATFTMVQLETGFGDLHEGKEAKKKAKPKAKPKAKAKAKTEKGPKPDVEWNEEFLFTGVTNPGLCTLSVNVLDAEGDQSKRLGETTLPLGILGARAGMQDFEEEIAGFFYKTKVKFQIDNFGSWGNGKPEENKLYVMIKGAVGLPTHVGSFIRSKETDPYLQLDLKGPDGDVLQSKSTKGDPKGSDPQWDEELVFENIANPAACTLAVADIVCYDSAFGGDTQLGHTELPVGGLSCSSEYTAFDGTTLGGTCKLNFSMHTGGTWGNKEPGREPEDEDSYVRGRAGGRATARTPECYTRTPT
ncbi:unnamed protein product [Prorocentrum cordatum]|uniref:C2 domain-containing protein n=1 Tax=Prorocentrum cordatum TaxID=2364126 RepID=A0ABN9YAG1_9DINO|nr:unnamed protein product [Polarella glacialis]